MIHIEIDHIEVSDQEIDVTYWVADNIEGQRLKFQTKDYDQWLQQNRNVSPNAYWDKWNSWSDEKQLMVFRNDMQEYLIFRTHGLRSTIDTTLNLDRKPMSKVAGVKDISSAAETA